jgi:hypothetical protein
MIMSDIYIPPIYSRESSNSNHLIILLWFFDGKGGSRFQEENPDGKTPDE